MKIGCIFSAVLLKAPVNVFVRATYKDISLPRLNKLVLIKILWAAKIPRLECESSEATPAGQSQLGFSRTDKILNCVFAKSNKISVPAT